MNNYINKKVEISEKVFSSISSTSKLNSGFNTIVGTITNIYNNKFIELDNKLLISLDYIYKIEIID